MQARISTVMSQWKALAGGDAMASRTKWRNRRLAAPPACTRSRSRFFFFLYFLIAFSS